MSSAAAQQSSSAAHPMARCVDWLLTARYSASLLPPFFSASYFIASSEVELGAPIDPKEYLSGRIFVGSTSAALAPSGAAAFVVPKAAATPFNRIKASNASAKNSDSGGAGGGGAAAMLQAILSDPSLLLLNRHGIVEHGEKAVVRESITRACRGGGDAPPSIAHIRPSFSFLPVLPARRAVPFQAAARSSAAGRAVLVRRRHGHIVEGIRRLHSGR